MRGGEEETKKNEGGEEGDQTKLDFQDKIMVKHSNSLSDKRGRRLRERETQDKIQGDQSWAERKG